MTKIRVRFAPSPTGELHIGGARTALFNYLFARRNGGTFVLRIDDTDLERSKEEYTEKLMQAMQWLGLKWDEGPFYQSRRLSVYTSEVNRLVAEKKAYRCYCSVDELAAGRELARKENRAYLYPGTCRRLFPEGEKDRRLKAGIKPAIRLLTPEDGETVVHDLIRGKVHFDNRGLDDFIILKSTGQPTYNFASVVDDRQLKISHVIRAEEHLSNTPRQVLCALALGYRLPAYAHVPMILAPDRSKLSKRHGATSVEEFRNLGFLPETLINYMALLGWSPGGRDGESDLIGMEQMIELFTLNRVGKTAAVYDTDKLTWMNGQYLRGYDLDRLAEAARPFFIKRGFLPENAGDKELHYLKAVLAAVRERAKTMVELAEMSFYFYLDDFVYEQKAFEKAFKNKGAATVLLDIAGLLKALDTFEQNVTETVFNEYCAKNNIPPGKVIQTVRLAVTGLGGGPGLFKVMELLGPARTIRRIEQAAASIRNDLP